MTPLNSESIKTFKEEVATLNKKNNFDVADCDNVYGGLESIISQFEMTENDPVRNNIELQTLERLLKSLEHIRSEMLESDPSSYTLEISGLLKDLYETLVLIESDLDTKKLRITVPKLTSYLIELEKHMVIDNPDQRNWSYRHREMIKLFDKYDNFKKAMDSKEFSNLQIAQIFKTLSKQEQLDYYKKLVEVGENVGYLLKSSPSPEKKMLNKESFLNLSPIDELNLIIGEISTLPIEEVEKLLGEQIPDVVTEKTPEEIEKDRKYDLKISQLEYFTYILEAKREYYTRASGYLYYKRDQRTSEKNVLEGYEFLGMTQEEIGKARMKKAGIDDFLEPMSYNKIKPSDSESKLRGIDLIIVSLSENPDLSLEDALKQHGYGYLMEYLNEFKIDIDSIKTEKDLEKFKFPLLNHLDGLKSYDLVREIGYNNIKDDLDAYSKEKKLFDISTYIDLNTHEGYGQGATKVDPEMTGRYFPEKIATNEVPVNQVLWKRAYQNVIKSGVGIGDYGIAKLENQVLQKFNEMQVALGKELKKPDGTPFTRKDAKAVALSTMNKIVYKEHEKLRYKDILEKMYKDKNAKINPDKLETFKYLYSYEGFTGLGIGKPETQDFLIDFGHEVAITLASMLVGTGAVNILAKAGNTLSKVGKLAKIAKFFNQHKRITAISSVVARNFTEALIFESTYNLAKGENLFHKDRWFWDVCWSALTFGALSGVSKGVNKATKAVSSAVSARLITKTPKLINLIKRVPKNAQKIVNNWIISGNFEAITLLLIGAVKEGIITINWKSDDLLAELKAYGLNFTGDLKEKFWQTYATVIGLKGGRELADKAVPRKPSTPNGTRVPRPKTGPNAKGKNADVGEKMKKQSAIKKAANFEALFKLFPNYRSLESTLKRAGLNRQWLEASLMDIKDPIKRYNAIRKIYQVIKAETADQKKIDPRNLLEKLKKAEDVTTATALEVLFKIYGSQLRFEPAEIEKMFGNKNTAFVAGEVLLKNMNAPEYVKKFGAYLETKLPAIETQLRSLFARALNGMEMTKEELLKVSKYIENNPILKMIDVLASTGGIKKLIMETKVGKVLTTGITGTLTLLYAQTAQAGTLGMTIAGTAVETAFNIGVTIVPTLVLVNATYGLLKGAKLRNKAANKASIAAYSAEMKKTLSDNEAAFRNVFGDTAFDEMMALQGQIGTGQFINIPYFGEVPKLNIKNFRDIFKTKSDRTTLIGRLGLLRMVKKDKRPDFEKHSKQFNADLEAFVDALKKLSKNSIDEIQKKEAERLFKTLTGEVKVEISEELKTDLKSLDTLASELKNGDPKKPAYKTLVKNFDAMRDRISGTNPILLKDFEVFRKAIFALRDNPTNANIKARDLAYTKLKTDIEIIKGTTSTIPGSFYQLFEGFDPNMGNTQRRMLVDQGLEGLWHILRNDPMFRKNVRKGEYYFYEIEKVLREAAANTNPADKYKVLNILGSIAKYIGRDALKHIALGVAIVLFALYSYNEYDSEENILQRAQEGKFKGEVDSIKMRPENKNKDSIYFADQKGFEKFLKENPGTEVAIAYDKLDRGNKKKFFQNFRIAPPPPANKDTNNKGQGKGQNEGVNTNVEVVPKMDLAGLEGLYGTNITSSPVVKKYSELPSDAVSDFTKLNEVIMKYCEALKNNLRSEEVDKWFNVYFEDPKVKEMLLNKISEKLDTL